MANVVNLARCRPATPDDATRLAAMRWDFYLEDGDVPTADRAAFEHQCTAFIVAGIQDGRWHHFVAEQDGEVIAMASIETVPLMPRPSRTADALGYLTNVYAVPQRRNQGVGGALLEHAKAWAQRQDLELLIVWPSDGSRDLYRRVGFRDDSEIFEMKLRQ